MPGVVFAGHDGAVMLHVTEPVHEPGFVLVGTQVGVHGPLNASHCSTHTVPEPHVVVSHVASATQVGMQLVSQPSLLHAHSLSQW